MHWQFRLGTPLLLTLVSLATVSPAWSAEKVAAKAPSKVRQASSETRSTARAPVAKTKTATPSVNSESAVTPASFSSAVVIQNPMVAPGEAVYDPNQIQDPNQIHNQVPPQNPAPRQRICRDCCLSRVHQTGCDVIWTEKENARDWFNYIRGYGPVVWVRNGPELSCHPPSIPFAKRIGGATAPQWGGVTGIPPQREIPPETVHLLHREDLKYRVLKAQK